MFKNQSSFSAQMNYYIFILQAIDLIAKDIFTCSMTIDDIMSREFVKNEIIPKIWMNYIEYTNLVIVQI